MRTLADVGVLVAAERDGSVLEWLGSLPNPPALSTITVAEALHGVERAAPEWRRLLLPPA